MSCRIETEFLTGQAKIFPGRTNVWTIALVPMHGFWDGKSIPDENTIGVLVNFFCRFVAMRELAPDSELNFFGSADQAATDKFMTDVTWADPVFERPKFWPKSIQRVPPLSASFYGGDPGSYDEKVPTVYVTLKFKYDGFASESKSWPWGGKQRLNRLINFPEWCPENLHWGALMAVQSPTHQPDASGDSIPTSIPGTDQAPAPNPDVPPVVDLGEQDPLVIELPGEDTTSISQYMIPMAGLLFAVWAFKKKTK